MSVAAAVEAASACGAGNEAKLNEIGLDHLLDRVARLAQARSERLHTDRAAAVEVGDHREVAPVHRVEAERVDLQPGERAIGDLRVDEIGASRMGEIAHAPKQPSGDTRGAA